MLHHPCLLLQEIYTIIEKEKEFKKMNKNNDLFGSRDHLVCYTKLGTKKFFQKNEKMKIFFSALDLEIRRKSNGLAHGPDFL